MFRYRSMYPYGGLYGDPREVTGVAPVTNEAVRSSWVGAVKAPTRKPWPQLTAFRR